MPLLENLTQEQAINGVHTPPGRVRTYLFEPEKQTTPHSCSLFVHRDLFTTLKQVTKALKGGAGVKVILDEFVAEPCSRLPAWFFLLDDSHPDAEKITEYQDLNHLVGFFEEEQEEEDVLIQVQDSLFDKDPSAPGVSIEESWGLFIQALTEGKTPIVDLSKLRPAGSVNDAGLVATGPIGYGEEKDNSASFFAIYDKIATYMESGTIFDFLSLLGTLNDTLRRGGFKRGIVCSSMNWKHPEFAAYLRADQTRIPGSHKKAAKIDSEILGDDYSPLRELLIEKVNSESVFLEKDHNDELHFNVCVGLRMKDRGTCLIWRVNLGEVKTPENLSEAFNQAALHLCELHTTWRDRVGDKADNYLPLEEDNQIGLDVFGLANALRQWGVSYREFVDAAHCLLDRSQKQREQYLKVSQEVTSDSLTMADRIVLELARAFESSTATCQQYMSDRGLPPLDRIHTVEPAQSHSFEVTDLEGYTICRAIWPPVARRTRRISDSEVNKVVDYGPVELAAQVGPQLYQELCEVWQLMMREFGKPHSISFDLWEEATELWLEDFLNNSPLQTKYYTFANLFSQGRNFRKKVMQIQAEPVTCNLNDRCAVCEE